jgi:hypothetical protein
MPCLRKRTRCRRCRGRCERTVYGRLVRQRLGVRGPGAGLFVERRVPGGMRRPADLRPRELFGFGPRGHRRSHPGRVLADVRNRRGARMLHHSAGRACRLVDRVLPMHGWLTCAGPPRRWRGSQRWVAQQGRARVAASRDVLDHPRRLPGAAVQAVYAASHWRQQDGDHRYDPWMARHPRRADQSQNTAPDLDVRVDSILEPGSRLLVRIVSEAETM